MPLEEARSLLKVAERDWEILLVLKDAPRVHLSGVAFHAQQLIEKSLKAVLAQADLPFDRSHDLIRLATTLTAAGHQLPLSLDELARLTPYAVVFRYDDTDIEILTRDEAVSCARRIRAWATQVVTNQEEKRDQP
ncbi:MAG: HEPN domain-containing protein [Azonexus sp.]